MEGANLVSLSLVTDLVNELVYGKVDAIVVDGAVAEQYAESNPDLVVAAASSELVKLSPTASLLPRATPRACCPASTRPLQDDFREQDGRVHRRCR